MSLYLLVLWPIFGAIAVYRILSLKGMEKRSDSICGTFVLICAGTEVLLVAFLMTENMTASLARFGGFGLDFRFNSFSALYCMITAFVWFMAVFLSREYVLRLKNRERFYFSFLLTLSSVIGIFLAANFFTLFLFIEMMSLSSYPLIAHDEEPSSLKSAGTYLCISVIGGLFILMGMLILYRQIGSLSYNTVFTFSAYTNPQMLLLSGILMLVGFGAIAGMYPLHIWLPGANASAPAPASALISGILTQCGLFGIITVTVEMVKGSQTWTDILICMGAVTMVWGAVCALLSSDLKKIFAYSSMSQTGLILIGIGIFNIDSSLYASSGIILHMINHSLIMLVLFGSASVIYMNVHSLELNDIRGFGHGKPLLNAIFLSGAMGIGGIPLWNGYISKALLHESIIQSGSLMLEIMFLLTGGLTIAYMTKVYTVLFIYKRSAFLETKTEYIDNPSRAALIISSVMLPFIGMFPNTTARSIVNYSIKKLRAEFLEPIYFFSGEMLTRAFIPLVIGFFLYILLINRRDTKNMISPRYNLEESLYRPLLRILTSILASIAEVFNHLFDIIIRTGIFVCSLNRLKKQHIAENKPDSSQIIVKKFSAFLLVTCFGLCAILTFLIIHSFFVR
ncbi:MAG: complex I subunit 5 family protein [Eubacteriales bacterium]